MTTLNPELVAQSEGRHVTFGRVLSRDRRRLVVDVCGVAVAFSARDGQALSPLGRAYTLLATLPSVGDGDDRAALHWEPPTRRRARRAPTAGALAGQGSAAPGEAPTVEGRLP